MIPRKVLVTGPGCLATQLDNYRHAEAFRSKGFDVVADAAQADIILCSTCANLSENEDESLAAIEALGRAKRPEALLVVTGCLPGINPDRLRKVFDGKVVPARTYEALNEILGAPQDVAAPFGRAGPCPNDECSTILTGVRNAWAIPTSAGCLGECTFCAIRFAIGRQRSRPIEDIARDLDEGLAAGYRDFVLVADDNGTYGYDIKTDIAELLEELFRRERDFRVVVASFNPWGFARSFSRLKELARSPKLYRMNVPMQHASPRMLKLMRRFYRPEPVTQRLLELRSVNPELRLSTGLIVGFPGETEEEFQACVDFVRSVPFDYCHVAVYDPRPNNTVPAALPPVPEDVKLRRYARLKQEAYFTMVARRQTVEKPREAALAPSAA